MIVAAVLGITVVLAVITLCEWPNLKQSGKKEKMAFAAITVIGGIMAVLYAINPDLPGPTQWIDAVFNPLRVMFSG
ncbi:MAG: hypothetical protein H0Z34_04235 [Brevibacillus sp.]|nr:hypothetical protein [Brevibacillus sp.]